MALSLNPTPSGRHQGAPDLDDWFGDKGDVVIPFAQVAAALRNYKSQPNHKNSMWSDESAAVVQRMWPDPKCTAVIIAGEIGRLFGWLPTRNSVISKAKRVFGYGYHKPRRKRRFRKQVAAKPKVTRTVKVTRIVNRRPQLIDLMIHEEDRALVDFNEAIPVERRKQLWELENNHCRYPVGTVGQPGFFFCAGPIDAENGGPYCREHRQFCTAGIPARKPTARRAA